MHGQRGRRLIYYGSCCFPQLLVHARWETLRFLEMRFLFEEFCLEHRHAFRCLVENLFRVGLQIVTPALQLHHILL